MQLVKLANSDSGARRYLAEHLPSLIEADPRNPQPDRRAYARPQWLNAVQLAGGLTFAEAAPALAKWITFRDPPGIGDTLLEETLGNSPAGTALIQIGDPAIPAMQRLLADGNRDGRWHATYGLTYSKSSKARAVLRKYAANGEDHELAEFLKRTMLNNGQDSTE
jgi:hypothetical protein